MTNYDKYTTITFEVKGAPPKKPCWNTNAVIDLRKAALDAKKNQRIDGVWKGPVKLVLTVYAPNINDRNFRQNGDDDPKNFIGDLDHHIEGVLDGLQAAPQNSDCKIHPDIINRDDIDPKVALIIEDDSQIVEIVAKKIQDDARRYCVEIVNLN